MEAAAEVGGVGERLKFAQRAWLRRAFEREQPLAPDLGEPRTLVAENPRLETEGDRGFGDSGEIDVGRDVDLARCRQRILGGAVF